MRFTLFKATVLALFLTLQSTSATISNDEFILGKALDASSDLINSYNGDASASHVHSLEARSSPHVSIFRRHSQLAKRCASHKKVHASKKDEKEKSNKHKSTTNNDVTKTNIKTTKKKSDSKSKSQSKSSHPSSSSGHVSDTNGSGDYSRVESNRGNNFWSQNNWDFWSYDDPTHGQVAYQSEQNAKKSRFNWIKEWSSIFTNE